MPISITGTGTITGISAGGLPDDCITTADIAGSAVTTAKLAQPMTLATAQATTSGTAIDFTGIPSWVKKITVMFSGVSVSGTSELLIQVGDAGGIEATGYLGSSCTATSGGNGNTNYTTGYGIRTTSSSDVVQGVLIINNLTGNLWVASGTFSKSNLSDSIVTAGDKTLSDTLTQVRITTVNGTDTFDAGSVNIMYEG